MGVLVTTRQNICVFLITLTVGFLGFLLGGWQKLYLIVSFDSWWHLSQGREIFRGNIWVDTLSFIASGKPNYTHSWLYDALIYKLYESFSLEGLIYGSLLLGVAVFYCQLTLSRLLHVPFLQAVIIGCLSWYISRKFFLVRPQQITPLFLLFLLLLLQFLRGPKLYCATTILFSLWSNLHGSFILGIAFLCLFFCLSYVPSTSSLATSAAESPKGSLEFLDGANRISSALYLKILLFSVLGSCLHLKGIYVFHSAFAHDPFNVGINKLIDEWHPESFASNPWVYIAAFLAISTGTLSRPRTRTSIFLVLLSVLPLLAARHIPIFCTVCFPLIASRLPYFNKMGTLPYKKLLTSSALIIGISIGTLLSFPLRPLTTDALLNYLPKTALKNELPITAATFLRENTKQARVFTLYEHGGFVGFILDGSSKIFIDSRVQPFTYQQMMDYLSILEEPDKAPNIVRQYNISHLIIPKTTTLPFQECQNFQDPQWKILCP